MVVKCSETCCADVHDDPDLDCTDFAHPAWWRGHDHTVKTMIQTINKILDDPFLDEARGGTFGSADLQKLRERLRVLAKKP